MWRPLLKKIVMRKIKIKMEWGMKQEMLSLIVLLQDGNYEAQNKAKQRLMEIADMIDEFNNQNK